MNLDTVRYFHINGLISGMFFSVLLVAVLFVAVFLLKRRHSSLFRMVSLMTLCFFCFWLFNVYFQLLPLPLEVLYPSWFFQLSKLALPIGLIIFTRLFIEISVLRSEASYVAYQQLKPAVYALIIFCVVACVAFLFMSNHHIVIGLTEILLVYASVLGSVFCFKAVQPRMLSWVMGGVLGLGALSFASIAYSVFLSESGHSILLLTIESMMIGLTMICLGFYVLVYSYHELITFSDYDAYDWRDLLGSIHDAIEKDQFYLVYQPKVNVLDNAVVGVEALLRWNDPKRGLVPPNDFISMSEKSYLIDTICRWVIEHAAKQANEFAKQGLNLSVAINFSVKNLHPKMISFLEQTLSKYQVKPELFIIEITETVFIQQTDSEKEALNMLADMGVGLSLDDYGTGYSSLSTLNALSIDELKIDKSFIEDIMINHEHRIIVESIFYMTSQMDMTVVAEGVENDDVLARLGDLGCNVVQGYGISKPMPSKELYKWLAFSSYAVHAS